MNSLQQTLKTQLHQWHNFNSGRMVDFAGWEMPIQYGSIIDEHVATRTAMGLFDVSHMGRFFFAGSGIDRELDRLTTRRVAGMASGRIRYSLMTNESGGILDDVLVYHLPTTDGDSFYMMVVNASNRDKIRAWIEAQKSSAADLEIDDRTAETAMIACQGPAANTLVSEVADIDPATLKYYTGTTAQVAGYPAIVSRTGYTGEDGCEIIVDNEYAVEVWEELHDRAIAIRGKACGLAARDTLRLEAGMPLYGHELSESINAASTDLDFAINLKDREFIGADAIRSAQQNPELRMRVGVELSDRRAAREGSRLMSDGQEIGVITSGAFSPTLGKSISMGYIDRSFGGVGTKVDVDIRGKVHVGHIAALPFYSRD